MSPPANALIQFQALFGAPLQHQRIKQVFALLYAFGQGINGIVRKDVQGSLGDQWATIQLFGHEMDRAAML